VNEYPCDGSEAIKDRCCAAPPGSVPRRRLVEKPQRLDESTERRIADLIKIECSYSAIRNSQSAIQTEESRKT
jgi:hypothetical protein